MINLTDALTAFNVAGIDITADFHTLSSDKVHALLERAKIDGYRRPLHANGSKARYYFYALQRRYNSGKR